jgi:hypothetical protein
MENETPNLSSENTKESPLAVTPTLTEAYTPEQQATDAEIYSVTPSGDKAESEDLKSDVSEIEAFESTSRTTYAGRLIEYITGVKIDDPNLPERLLSDQNVIRAKYKLPPREMRFDLPGEFEKVLLEIAQKYKIRIDSQSECGEFFTKHKIAGGVFLGRDNRIGINVDRKDQGEYAYSLSILEHELVHGLQNEHSPRMPIELKEYEAYIVGANLNPLLGMDEERRISYLETFVGLLIGSSVNIWYSEQSEEMGEVQRPTWDNPEYFEN